MTLAVKLINLLYFPGFHSNHPLFLLYMYIRETCESALKERHGHDSSQIEGFIDRSTSLLKQLDALGRVFRKAAEDDTPTEVSLLALFPYWFLYIVCVCCVVLWHLLRVNRYLITYVVRSHLTFFVTLSSRPMGLHMKGQWSLTIWRR